MITFGICCPCCGKENVIERGELSATFNLALEREVSRFECQEENCSCEFFITIPEFEEDDYRDDDDYDLDEI